MSLSRIFAIVFRDNVISKPITATPIYLVSPEVVGLVVVISDHTIARQMYHMQTLLHLVASPLASIETILVHNLTTGLQITSIFDMQSNTKSLVLWT